jgi:hypothetical protein
MPETAQKLVENYFNGEIAQDKVDIDPKRAETGATFSAFLTMKESVSEDNTEFDRDQRVGFIDYEEKTGNMTRSLKAQYSGTEDSFTYVADKGTHGYFLLNATENTIDVLELDNNNGEFNIGAGLHFSRENPEESFQLGRQLNGIGY